MPSDIERAYITGLFDGDGCLSLCMAYDSRTDKRYPRAQAIFASKNREPLDYVYSVLGYGRIYNTKQNTQWELRITKISDLEKFCEFLEPYIRIKKKHLVVFKQGVEFKVKHDEDSEKFREQYVKVLSALNGK